jgi:hypothetical protein
MVSGLDGKIIDFKGVHYPREAIFYAVFLPPLCCFLPRSWGDHDGARCGSGQCYATPLDGKVCAIHSATAILAGIETAHTVRKGQFGVKGHTVFQQFAVLSA